MQTVKILCIGASTILGHYLQSVFVTKDGAVSIDIALNTAEAHRKLIAFEYDMLVAEGNLPDESGVMLEHGASFLHKARKEGMKTVLLADLHTAVDPMPDQVIFTSLDGKDTLLSLRDTIEVVRKLKEKT